MNTKTFAAAAAVSVAGLFAASAAEAHDRHGNYRNDYRYNDRAVARVVVPLLIGAAIYNSQSRGYGYPQQSLPVEEVSCQNTFRNSGAYYRDEYGYKQPKLVYAGSVRDYYDPNNGASFQRGSMTPCYNR